MKRIIFYIAILLFCFTITVKSQTSNENLQKVIEKAELLFNEDEFAQALPLFSQLISLYPKDPNYNYKFGVCMLKADRRDTYMPIKFLEFASKNELIDADVFYYLGLAYHLNYRFYEAIRAYNTFKSKTTNRKFKKLDVERQIQMCNNGKALLGKITDLFVFEKVEVNEKDFFRSYLFVNELGGHILTKPANFITKIDKKKKDKSVVFYSDKKKEVYYSSYGKDGKTGKDIYYAKQLENGKWGEPKLLDKAINTPYDEDYPFMMPDGKTFFFCSKGHNSMGGYDIFKSTYDVLNNSWTTPINVDFAINTPFDDILFMPDSLQENAYFSSDRVSIDGMITVYKVRMDVRPEVKEDLNLIASDDLTILNDSNYLKSLALLKEKQKLNVNANPLDYKTKVIPTYSNNFNNNLDYSLIDTTGQAIKTPRDLYNIPMDMPVEDIVKTSLKQVNAAKNQQKQVQELFDASLLFEKSLEQEAEDLIIESDEIIRKSLNISDENIKQKEISRANELKYEAQKLKNEAEIAKNIANLIKSDLDKKQNSLKTINEISKNIENNVKDQPRDSSLSELKSISNLLVSNTNSTNALFTKLDNDVIEKINTKKRESTLFKDKSDSKLLDAKDDKTEAEKLRNDAKKVKNDNLKKEYITQAEDLENEAKIKENDAKILLENSNKLKKESDSIKTNQLVYNKLKDDIIDFAKNPTKTNLLVHNNNIKNNNIVNKNKVDTNAVVNNNNLNVNNNKVDTNKIVVNNNKVDTVKNTNTNLVTNSNVVVKDSISKVVTAVVTKYDREIKKSVEETNNAFNIAVLKNNESINKAKLAENTAKEASNTNDSLEKIDLIKKAIELQNESNKLAMEALIAYNIAKQYEEKSNSIKTENQIIGKKITEIENLIKSNSVNNAKEKLNELNEKEIRYSENKKNIDYDEINKNLKSTLDIKDSESKNLIAQADELNKKYLTQKEAADKVKKEADKKKDGTKKTELLNKYTDLNNQANLTKTQVEDLNTRGKNLKIESNLIDNQINFTNEVKSSIENNSNPNAFIDPNDKSKLENNVSNYKNISELALNNKKIEDIAHVNDVQNDSIKTNLNLVNSINPTDTLKENQVQISKQKVMYFERTLSLVNKQIDLYQKALVKTDDQSEKLEITKNITKLNIQKDSTNKNLIIANENFEKLKKDTGIKDDQIVIVKTDETIEAKKLDEQSKTELTKANQLKIEAKNNKDPEQKQKLLDDANKLEISSINKQSQSLEIKAIANKNIIFENNLKIQQIKVTDDKNDSLDIAKMLTDESLILFDKSQKLRDSISKMPPSNSRTFIGRDAEKYENQAIEKQNKAILIYNNAIVKGYIPDIENVDTLNNVIVNNNKIDTNKVVNNNLNVNNNKVDTNKVVVNNNFPDTNKVNNTNKIDSNKIVVNKNPDTNKVINNNKVDTNKTINNVTNNITITLIKNSKTDVINKLNYEMQIPGVEFSPAKGGNAKNIVLYNNANPIPINSLAPEGIVFKVQIGAFRKPINQAAFNGMNPISGQATPNGLTCYFAGIFGNVNDAFAARNKIRGIGYKDAFVVAFLNGKKISIYEASALLKAGKTFINQEITVYLRDKSKSTNPEYQKQLIKENIAAIDNNNVNVANNIKVNNNNVVNNNVNIANNEVIRTIAEVKQELFYTVQVGVYVKPVSSAQLFNVQPLFNDLMPNNYIRYFSGVFNSVDEAIVSKNNIIVKGIKDAFVVAWSNGKKISIAEAKKIQAENPDIMKGLNNTPINLNKNDSLKLNGNKELVEVLFKVQLGIFVGIPPAEIVDGFKTATNNDYQTFVDAEGKTVFTAGSFKEFQTAIDYKNKIIAAGVKDAFVIAFQGKNRIEIKQAFDLLKK
ncbi:MAG: PD40 domain-containing protein [Bacteroidetes bacterium]|nr:PD40 domain-containing protein [Bacteroidota bacterium]